MKGLRKVKPRAVNPNPRGCPIQAENVIPTVPVIETVPLLPIEEKVEEKKSIKTQTTHKTSKWNK